MGIGFNDANSMKACTTEEAVATKMNYFCGGSPHIIWDSELVPSYLNTSFGVQSTKRIGFGFNNNEIIIGFPTGNTTLTSLAELMKNNGCQYAIAFDGGGSATVGEVSTSGTITYLNQKSGNRACGTWLLIYLKKDEQPLPDLPAVYELTNYSYCNMRTEPNVNSALATSVRNPAKLYKGERITVFEIVYNATENRYWGRSYGYWVAMEYFTLV